MGNWPVTDNSKQHLILGGGEKFLHPNVDPSLLSGIMLNPMQQSEPSKIALFSAAQYAWKQWKSEEAKKVNDIAFNFVENGKFIKTFGYPNDGKWEDDTVSEKGFGLSALKQHLKDFHATMSLPNIYV